MPVDVAKYNSLLSGPKGSVLIVSDQSLSKYVVDDKKMTELVKDGSQYAVSADGEKLLFKSGDKWRVVSTAKPADASEGVVAINLRMELDRKAEWTADIHRSLALRAGLFLRPQYAWKGLE
jgi:tricorn protease